jgi:hypothetical protein
MTTAGDLRECLLRLLRGGFVVSESPVYLLSRDGEQLRPIEVISYRPAKRTAYIERGSDEAETLTVAQLLIYCHAADPAAEIRLIADGRSQANSEPLDSVKLAAEIKQFNRVDFSETDVVLCT